MQSILEFSGFSPRLDPARRETAEGFLPVRRLLSSLGFYLLQTGDANGSWTCAYRAWSGGCAVHLQTGAPAVFFGTVSRGRTGFVLPHGLQDGAFLCGIPWPENQIGLLGGGSRFGLRVPAGTPLRLVFHTALSGDRVWAHGSAFLEADPLAILRVENSLFPSGARAVPRNPAPPSGVLLLQSLEGQRIPHPIRAQRDCECVGAALDIFMADLTSAPSPAHLSRILGVPAQTLEHASLAVTGHSPDALHRLVCWNAARPLLKPTRETLDAIPATMG